MPPSPTSTPSGTDLETDLLTHLATTSALDEIHITLLSTLQRLGWTDKIRRLSLELLRANRCERFDDVVEAVVASAQGRSHPFLEDSEYSNSNGNGNGDIDSGNEFQFSGVDVRIPSVVVEQGVRAIKDVLREVVVLEDEEGGGGSGGGGPSSSNIAVEVGEKRPGVNGEASPAKKAEKKSKQGKLVKNSN
ncbi:hypothetical protein BJY04DRAFT_184741 [Aspergillus karnatakaensis]|uniref:uncharacterized protein n=1 Tax=Aspergillus karnatakaensis TaxID=1810916 RepID=UPI003CCD250C